MPETIVSAIQESRFDPAVAALDALVRDGSKPADDRAFFGWIKGIVLRRAGRLDEAAAAIGAALHDFPGSAWTGKLRGELAGVELARKHPAEAERLARAEVETLLNPGRKDRLAAVVEDFAGRLLEPGDPLVKPEPEGAYALLSMARGLARGDEARARILFTMARASRAAGNLDRAAADLRKYLAEHPRGADRAQASYQLGEVLMLGQGQPDAARAQWLALARQLEGPAKSDAAARDLRARCLYQVGRSYLNDLKADDRDARNRAGLGIAALRRFLAAEPGHELAVEAAYEVADAEWRVGRSDQALDAFRAFLDGSGYRVETPEARRRQAELAARATFEVGRILQQQGKLAEAATAFARYVDRFPNGPQFADAQRHPRRRARDRRRARPPGPLCAGPRSARGVRRPQPAGSSRAAGALPQWPELPRRGPGRSRDRRLGEPGRPVPGRCPGGARALGDCADLRGEEGRPGAGDRAAPPGRPGAVAVEGARQRIAILEAKSLVVVTPRSYRTGEVPALKVTTRNIASLTISAYRLDAEDYFRKKHALRGVESLDIDLVAPEHTWTEPVPSYAKYVPVERTLP